MRGSRNIEATRREELLATLGARFEQNMSRHEGLAWARARARLEANDEKLWSLIGRYLSSRERGLQAELKSPDLPIALWMGSKGVGCEIVDGASKHAAKSGFVMVGENAKQVDQHMMSAHGHFSRRNLDAV